MIQEKDFKDLKDRVEKLEKTGSGLKFPMTVAEKLAIEKTIFAFLRSSSFNFPVYTTVRDVAVDPPKHGDIWLEDVAGPTRSICGFIVAPTTGVGTKYSVAIT